LKLNDFGILDVNTLKYEVSVKPHDLSEALLNVTVACKRHAQLLLGMAF
jgi:hypothetical protein